MIPSYSKGDTNNDGSEYIYYCANEEQVKKFESKSEISNFAESSEAAHKRTHEVQTLIINSINAVRLDVGQSKDDLKKAMTELKGQAGPSNADVKETTESKGQVEPSNADLKKEIAELREQIKHAHCHDELRNEMAGLKDLVQLLVERAGGN